MRSDLTSRRRLFKLEGGRCPLSARQKSLPRFVRPHPSRPLAAGHVTPRPVRPSWTITYPRRRGDAFAGEGDRYPVGEPLPLPSGSETARSPWGPPGTAGRSGAWGAPFSRAHSSPPPPFPAAAAALTAEAAAAAAQRRRRALGSSRGCEGGRPRLRCSRKSLTEDGVFFVSDASWKSPRNLTRVYNLIIYRNGFAVQQTKALSGADTEENTQAAEIERRIAQEAKAEKHIQKLLLLGAGESGKSTIFKQIKLLFQTGFDEAELKSYIPVIHANVFQTIKILYDGAKEFMQNETNSSKYVVSLENKEIGEKLSEIGGRLDYPYLTKELAREIETLWNDAAIQETYSRGNILQVPDCAHYFMKSLHRVSDVNYIPTKEDVLYARVRTTGVAEIQFSPLGESKKSGEVYRLFDVGGQKNERRKWIHLFEGVTAVIFCAAISEYDQMLFEDESKNRMMETKELFDWVLKQPCFEKTSFMLFLNKFDIFEEKVLKVPLNVCEWFKDYRPMSTGKQEVEHAYEFVKKKFEELYFQSTSPDQVDRVFKIYRTTALDQKLVKKTFKLVDETLRRRNLIEAGLL